MLREMMKASSIRERADRLEEGFPLQEYHSINRSSVRMQHGTQVESLLQTTTPSAHIHGPYSSTATTLSMLLTIKMVSSEYGLKETPIRQASSSPMPAVCTAYLSAWQVTSTSTIGCTAELKSGERMQMDPYPHCPLEEVVSVFSLTPIIHCTAHCKTITKSSKDRSTAVILS